MQSLIKPLSLLLLMAIVIACNTSNNSNTDIAIQTSVTQLLSDPITFDGKVVVFDGTITHICRNTGDKMRVMQNGSDLSLMVMLNDYSSKFGVDSEGMEIRVWGIVNTMVTNIDELEQHIHIHGEEDHECSSTEEAVAAMKARGLDASVHTSLQLTNYEIL